MGTNGLPGHRREQYLAERRALRAAEDVLLAAGCKVVEVPSSFDDGLDLFVALTNEHSVQPYMAAVQVKGGGVLGRTGELTNWINIYRTRTGMVHGAPGRAP